MMMRAEYSLFLSIVETILSKCMRSVIRTQAEWEESSWRESSTRTQLPENIIRRRTYSLEELFSLPVTNSNSKRLMNTLRNTWKTTLINSPRPQLEMSSSRLRRVLAPTTISNNMLLNSSDNLTRMAMELFLSKNSAMA
jgi:hypothetical protein